MRFAVLALAFVAGFTPAAIVAAQDSSEEAGAKATSGEVETLYRARNYAAAIAKAEELRAAAGGVARADDEYYTALSEAALNRDVAANERLRRIVKTYPGTKAAIDASIDLAMDGVDVPKGFVTSPDARAKAAAAAKSEEEIATKLAADPANAPNAARAWYAAGNAWRIAEVDANARRAYEASAKVGTEAYPAKAALMLAILASRTLDLDAAKNIVADCTKRFTGNPAYRCGKEARRWAAVGMAAPPLSVETWISGEPVDLTALKGNVVLVWFFSTTCPHCQASMPEIAALRTRLEGKPFRTVGITNNEDGQTTESAKAFVARPEWGFTYPAGVDKAGATQAAFHAPSVPSAVLVDKKGMMRWAGHPGYLSDAVVDALLAE